MRLMVALIVAVSGAVGLAQEVAVSTSLTHVSGGQPALTVEDRLLVQAVLALQKTASAECDALPSVKQYAELVAKVNAQMKASGKAIDWRTGELAPPPAKAVK